MVELNIPDDVKDSHLSRSNSPDCSDSLSSQRTELSLPSTDVILELNVRRLDSVERELEARSQLRAELNMPTDTAESVQRPGTFDSPPESPNVTSEALLRSQEAFASPQLGASPTSDLGPSSVTPQSPTSNVHQKSGFQPNQHTKSPKSTGRFEPKCSSTPKTQQKSRSNKASSPTTPHQRVKPIDITARKTVKLGDLKKEGRLEKSSPPSPKGLWSAPSTSSVPASPRRQSQVDKSKRQDPRR